MAAFKTPPRVKSRQKKPETNVLHSLETLLKPRDIVVDQKPTATFQSQLALPPNYVEKVGDKHTLVINDNQALKDLFVTMVPDIQV